ncbi:unnamed protein product [Adineta steineri]|uniref:G domain-containing protein n=1 Tax=Adineta steineri TaxID=433720 RepID=A0A818I3Q8_9BILA|nr:unnamed protein product [Adineta steineri]CAF3518495.1 unnamed protein product [Adineta steineri]
MTQVKRFVVLGDAGAGKSAFINTMFNYCYGTQTADEVFKSENQSAVKLAIPCKGWTDLVSSNNPSSERDINDQTKSQTMTSNMYSLQFNKDLTFELIDTPGFNDTEGISNDESNLEEIEKVLSAVPFLNGIIIVANGSMARLGTSFQHFLYLLHEICPNNLMDNICVVLTNCDDVSCNMDSTTLHDLLNVNDKMIFRIQNNIFRWDRTIHADKKLRNFRQNFEDVIDTIDKLIPVLEGFDEVSTDHFSMCNLQQSLIDKSIQELIERMISLLCANQEEVNAKNGILNATATMQANKNWEKQHEITAIRLLEVQTTSNDSEVQIVTSTNKSSTESLISSMISLPTKLINKIGNTHKNKKRTKQSSDQQISSQKHDETSKILVDNCATCSNHFTEQELMSQGTSNGKNSKIDHDTSTMLSTKNSEPIYRKEEIKIHLTLPDNDVISHHDGALKQVCILGNDLENLEKKQEALRHELNSLLEQLTIHVEKVRAINKYVDLFEKHNNLLTKFLEKIKATDSALDMKGYFNKVINILSKPSTTSDVSVDSQIALIERMEIED